MSRLLSVMILILCSQSALAHEMRPAIADLTVIPHAEAKPSSPESAANDEWSKTDSHGNETTPPAALRLDLRVNLEAMISEIGPEHENTDSAPVADFYDELRSAAPDKLESLFREYLPVLLDNISLIAFPGRERLSLSLLSVEIPETGDTRLPRDSRLQLTASYPAEATAVSWQWNQLYGPIILRADRLDSENQPLEDGFSQYLQPGNTSDLIALDSGGFAGNRIPGEDSQTVPLNDKAPSTGSQGSNFLDYVIIGFEHILPKGVDHILFVIGLFLLSPRLKPIVLQVSMFTLAHTLTLALGISGIVTVPSSIVEPLIALSITVVCIENLFGRSIGRIRLLLVFSFGLLHGLGFAGVLSDIGLQQGQFVASLIAFNIGVELGQLSIVLLCFVFVGWAFKNKHWYRKIVTIPGSLATGGVGLLWFFQRLPSLI